MQDATPALIVLTQNAFGGGPRWDRRRTVLARRIAQVQPDVIGLQEVHADSPEGPSQAHELAELLGGYHVDYAPARIEPNGHCEGVALLCKRGVRERMVEALTLDPGDFWDRAGQRVVLGATLEWHGQVLDVFVTHLSLSRRARMRTARELMAFAARERARSGSHAGLLLGDLNAQPGEPVIAGFEGCEPSLGGPWVDTWKLANGPRARGGTWPAVAPFRRIDYVFLQGQGAWMVAGCDVEPVAGSDHRGLLARLQPLAPADADVSTAPTEVRA